MTFGEKLKKARIESGLSQEQFAENLAVSRSAVAKWESDRGMPDISNLKAMSQMLGVSIDHLVSDGDKLSLDIIKKPIDLSSYEKTGKCRSKADAAVLAEFGDCDMITALTTEKKLSKLENLLEWTILPMNSLRLTENLKLAGNSWYLAERGSRQYLLNVTKEFITSQELPQHIGEKKFMIGELRYKRLYRLK